MTQRDGTAMAELPGCRRARGWGLESAWVDKVTDKEVISAGSLLSYVLTRVAVLSTGAGMQLSWE